MNIFCLLFKHKYMLSTIITKEVNNKVIQEIILECKRYKNKKIITQ